MKRVLVAALIGLVAARHPRLAQEWREAIVIVMEGASLPELLAVPELRSLAAAGGVALMNGRSDVRHPSIDRTSVDESSWSCNRSACRAEVEEPADPRGAARR